MPLLLPRIQYTIAVESIRIQNIILLHNVWRKDKLV